MFIPPTCNINACYVLIGMYFVSGTGVEPFTLEQNHPTPMHVCQFPNFAQVSVEVNCLPNMLPLHDQPTILALTPVLAISGVESDTIEYAP